MSKIFLISLLCIFVFNQNYAQTVVLLPSAGVQSTISTVEGSSPVVSTNSQYKTGVSASIRAYLDNKKAHGFFIGLSAVNHGISVKTFDGTNSISRMSSSGRSPRLELGYQLITKPIFLSSITNKQSSDNNKFNRGLFFQIQPMIGMGYNIVTNSGSGSIGGGSTNLKEIYSGSNNFSFLTGGNLYFGKNDRQWFFISVMKNWNFGNYTGQGVLNSQYNGNFYQNNIKSFGSGTSFSIGVPIRLGGKR